MKGKSVWLLAVVGLMWGALAGGLDVPESRAATSTLDLPEETHLIFMREEEKLARDVYLTLAGL